MLFLFETESFVRLFSSDYADYMSKYADFVKSFEKWNDEELNTAEIAYYGEVQARVSKKLLEIA